MTARTSRRWLADLLKLRYRGRLLVVIAGLLLMLAIIVTRLLYLHVPQFNHGFLQEQGDKRNLRRAPIPAHRGTITDRNGDPLAVSTPMARITVSPLHLLCWLHDERCSRDKLRDRLNPDEVKDARKLADRRRRWEALCQQLAEWYPVDALALQTTVRANSTRQHLYLINQRLMPDQADFLRKEFDVPAIHFEEVYQRYYPASEVTAHLVGFTGRDDNGVEGVELSFDKALQGEPGYRRILTDRRGDMIRDLGVYQDARQGQSMALSIDLRLQYLMLRELQKGVDEAGARAGTAVLIDVRTGEILAMANVPSYNPNNPAARLPEYMRNRAVVDVMEPGSTVKPFAALAALYSGRWNPDSYVPIESKQFRLGHYTIKDVAAANGGLTLTNILVKSSNIGITKVALDIGAPIIRDVMSRVGFGAPTGVGFPGERSGTLPNRSRWPDVETATLAYGYGLAITPLQLAQAYAVLGNMGLRVPLTLQRRDAPPQGTQVLDPQHVRTLIGMLQQVVETPGGVYRAQVPGYHVAGKSGTARKNGKRAATAQDDGYRYRGLFTGLAPVSSPRLALTVVIDEPDKSKTYYGGAVAAPVFSRIMAGALRMLNIAPDNLPTAGEGGAAPAGEHH